MSEHDDPRAELRDELASVAASLRAYLEWQQDTGAVGIPRRPRSAVVAPPETSAAPAAIQERAPAPVVVEAPILVPAQVAPALRPARAPARPLDVIAAEIATCQKCELGKTRTNTVVSRGSADAKLVFIGEAPGADEDEQGLPFVGRAGQLLDRMIGAMGMDPAKDVYVANIIKCRPPGNRKPEPAEIETCMPYLHEQLETLEPKVIVALGNTAVGALLGTTLGITKMRGQWKLYRGKVPVMPTFHPSYLLRPSAQQFEAKKQAWEDLQAVMKELGLSPKKPGA
ncbi:MAG: Uracil-DNA glycosylase, family 4 [Labilithrix sp.]|nr:Uracil-DNA glycosylase, family 4 [Labilithrix sp.]